MPYPGLLFPEPLPLQQATADPCLLRRHSNIQSHVWLSLCGVSWCAQGFSWALCVSGEYGVWLETRFHPSYHLAGASPLPLVVGSFFGGIQHSPVDNYSAMSCNFGILAGEDEGMSFYSVVFIIRLSDFFVELVLFHILFIFCLLCFQ